MMYAALSSASLSLSAIYGYRLVTYSIALLGVVVAGMFAALVREPSEEESRKNAEGEDDSFEEKDTLKPSMYVSFKKLVMSRNLVLLFLASGARCACDIYT